MHNNEISLKEKTAKGLLWGGLSNGIQQILMLVLGLFFARNLKKYDYGLVGVLAIFSAIAATLTNSGFSTALVNNREATHKDYNAVFWFSAIMGVVLYLALFFAAPLIAAYFGQPELVSLSRVLFLGFLFSSFSIVSFTLLFKNLEAKQQTFVNTAAIIVSGTVGIVLIFNGITYWALAIQSTIYVVILAVLRMAVSPFRPSFSFDFSPLKQMFPFSVKILITGIFTVINNNIFSVILGKNFTFDDVGSYSNGKKWSDMGYTFIGGMINFVTQPILAQINDEKTRQLTVFRKFIRFGAFVSFPLMLGLAFVAPEFVVIAVKEQWLTAVPFLQLFCIWGAFGFLSTLYVNLVFTRGKSNIYMYVSIACGLLQLLAIVVLYRFGIFPMVTGYVAMYFASLLIWQYFVGKIIGLKLFDVLRDIAPYLAITLACFAAVWLVTHDIQNLYLLLSAKILLSAALYLITLKLCKSAIFIESLEFLKNRLRK